VVSKGWTTTPAGGPIEIVAASAQRQLVAGGVAAIPTLNPWALVLMIVVLTLAAAINGRVGQRRS